MTTERPTALERRHPEILAMSQARAANARAEDWYRNGQCSMCGVFLDDYTLSIGMETCGNHGEDGL